MGGLSSAFYPPPVLPPRAPVPEYVPWLGASGRVYQFQVYPIGTNFLAKPGVYLFALKQAGTWYAVYVGETGSFHRRLYAELESHHQLPAAQGWGATHVGVLHLPGAEWIRRGAETDLRRSLQPCCNRQ